MANFETLMLVGLIAVLAFGVFFFRKSIALICWIVSGHIDIGIGGFASAATQSPLLNGVKILGFPSWLMLRFRRNIRAEFKFNVPTLLWSVFIGYATASIVWAPDRLFDAGVKQIGYFLTYSIGYMVLYAAWRSKSLTLNNIIISILIASVLAFVQTFVLGNVFGETLNYSRYVSFTSKQQFGEYLFSSIVFMLFVPKVRMWLRSSIMLLLWVQLFLNGSRAGVLGAFTALIIFLLIKGGIKGIIAAILLVGVSSTAYLAKDTIYDFVEAMGKDNRIYELVEATKNKKGIETIGTANARLEFWGATLRHMEQWTLTHKIFGKGVSSAGLLVNESYFSRSRGDIVHSDPNRTMHNELLRVAFEYGWIGLLIFVSFILSLFVYAFKSDITNEAKMMMVAFIPGFLLFLSMENIFTGSGAAGGIGFMMVISYVHSTRLVGKANTN